MTRARQKSSYISVEEYFKLEEKSRIRHEYVDGQLFAMTGATVRHSLLSGNVFSLLRAHLKGGPCQVYMHGLKLRVEASNCYYYPDVLVSCGSFDLDSTVADNPVLAVEVLSPSTSTIDRREKVLAYKQVASLREYVIVHQKRKRVWLHRKNADGQWEVTVSGAGEELTLKSFGTSICIKVDSIYENVDVVDSGRSDGSLPVREDYEDEAEYLVEYDLALDR